MKCNKLLLVLCTLLPIVTWAAEYPATLTWSQRAEVSLPVSGVVKTIEVKPGDRVSTGQRLLALDERHFKNAVYRASSQIKKLTLTRDEAQREFERNQELYERTVTSQHDLEVAEIAYNVALADYANARSELTRAKLDLEYSIAHAPFDAVVLAVNVAVGESVINEQQAMPLVVIGSDRPMLARAVLNAEQLTKLAPGAAAEVQVNGRRYEGKITSLGLEPVTVGDASGYELSVSFDAGNAVMRSGLPAVIVTK